MNRGSESPVVPRNVHPLDASMRPRFMNRGSIEVPVAKRAAAPASMRPRFMNRGSWYGGTDITDFKVLQ